MPFIYLTTYESRTIQQEYIQRGREGRVGLDVMPLVSKNVAKVRWTQADNYTGLQNLRGMDGRPTRVNRVGMKTLEYEPGVFGEYVTITETELTNRAGSLDVATTPIDISDLTNEADSVLIGREWDRIESSIWTLLTTGTLSIILDGPNGTQTGYFDQYTFQSYTSLVPWLTSATATPLLDFQNLQQLGYGAGRSVNFGTGAVVYMNQVTANRLLNNANAADFGGRRNQYGATLNNLGAMNNYFSGQNLPTIVVYDQGYYPIKGGAFQKFLPNGVAVVVGQRPGNVAIGNYIMTRNANNGFRPGTYRHVVDRVNAVNAEKRVPPNIEVHRGHNGGPAIYYPSAIVVMTTG